MHDPKPSFLKYYLAAQHDRFNMPSLSDSPLLLYLYSIEVFHSKYLNLIHSSRFIDASFVRMTAKTYEY